MRRRTEARVVGPLVVVLLISMASWQATVLAAPGRTEIEELAKEFLEGVEALTQDSMEGRGLSTDGIRRAADWIEGRLRDAGLEPAFDGSYRQSFRVKVGVELAEGNELDGVAEQDWTPLGFSSSGEFAGELAFVGYGIEAPEVGFQELEGADLEGKVVLMLRYEPQEKDGASPFAGRKPSRWSAMRYKVLKVRERGAAAVVFVVGPLQDEDQDKLPPLKNDGPQSPAGLPVLQVRTGVAAEWLRRIGVDLVSFQEAVDRDLRPRSVASTGLRLRGRIALNATYTETENLAGRIPGRGPLADESVVIGAHYDHLGYGGEGSMRPNEETLHRGADDNASGTVAALLVGQELVRSLADLPSHRGVVVALFSAEEVGLAGSAHFVEAPPVPLDRTVAMVNLDMVGRLRDDTLIALGSESAREWDALIEAAATAVPELQISSHGDGYGPSDQTSFYASGVPVLHLFTGGHEQHHTPEDDAALLNTGGAARVATFTVRLVEELSRPGEKLTYVRSSSGPTMTGDSRGYGAYLGTIPDYRAMEAAEGGVLLSDVRPGGPADQAGIRGGDRIVSMAGTRIENLYDMTYALQDNKPGQTIEVVVVRDEGEAQLSATLGDRARWMSKSREPAPSPHGGAPEDPTAPAAQPPVPVDPHAAPATPPMQDAAPQTSPATQPAGSGDPHAAPISPPATPAPPHGMPAAAEPETTGVAPFYQERPGAGFVIGAGQPFADAFDDERHLTEVRQLTFGGENAEAYFSPDGRQLIFQATTPSAECDQQYILDLATGETRQVSNGKGRTTCGYFDWPEADRIVFASTHGDDERCPPPPDHSRGYVWALYDSYDIWAAEPDGSGLQRLTDTPGYDAEATWCHRGGKLVFTSVRDGDLDLYAMDEAGEVTRLTDEPGYDGGAFYSPDCSEIVWRASRPRGQELEAYRALLEEGLIRPNALEIFLMNADGSDVRQLTSNGAANFCPTFTADGARILFSSNVGSASGREFDLWLVGKEGGEPQRITGAPGFDGFPQFSPDGHWLVWASNRAAPESRETNLFIARWAD